MQVRGVGVFLADALVHTVQGAHVLWLLRIVVAFVVLLTEPVNNTASAALMTPVCTDAVAFAHVTVVTRVFPMFIHTNIWF